MTVQFTGTRSTKTKHSAKEKICIYNGKYGIYNAKDKYGIYNGKYGIYNGKCRGR